MIEFQVNQIPHQVLVGPSATLLDVLRQDLGLKGTKRGCDQGHCGACTVIMDGKTVNACMVLAVQADGKKITTIEGLSTGDRLHPLQEAFVEEGAVQCGFCTPGMILSAKALLDEIKTTFGGRDPGSPFRKSLPVHRVTSKIVKAIQKAAQAMDSQGAKSMKCWTEIWKIKVRSRL